MKHQLKNQHYIYDTDTEQVKFTSEKFREVLDEKIGH